MDVKKTLIIIIIGIMLIMFPYNVVFADASGDGGAGGSLSQDLGLGNLDDYKGTNPNSNVLKFAANNILGIIQTIGVVASVVMLMAIGIKYMVGSVEERANYKQTLKPYIIGAFILFTGSLLPNLIYQFAQNI